MIFLVFMTPLIQHSYAQNIRTATVKAHLDDAIVKLGENNELRVTILDRSSDKPLSGALVKVVTIYPGGTYYRAVSELTDASGKASIIIPTSKDSDSDTVEVGVTISQTGYPDITFSMYFLAVSKDIND